MISYRASARLLPFRPLAACALAVALFTFNSCADDEDSAFDPNADRIAPELLTFDVTNEGQQLYASWSANEPVRIVIEYGDAPDELWRHSYSGSKLYSTSGAVKLVAAPSGRTYSVAARLRDRAGNEVSIVPETPSFDSGTVAPEDLLQFVMVDVGWGDALFLRAPDGTKTLIDAGHPLDGAVVRRFLASQGVTTLDFASLSHVHDDHIGGFTGDSFALADGVFQTYNAGASPIRCGTFLDIFDKTASSAAYTDLEDVMNATGSPIESVVKLRWGASSESEPALRWGTNLRVDLLSAGRKDYLLPDFILQAEAGSVVNNDSMIYRVQFGNFVMLLMGDGEFTTEQFLEDHWPQEVLRASILKVGHHGSNDASSERFLKTVDPRVALIPNALSENPGVQHPNVLGRLRNFGADMFASDRAIPNRARTLPGVRADIHVWTDGDGFTIVAIPSRFE